MTTEEFSNEFDILLNSYSNKLNFEEEHSIRDIVLNEYEKSVYLTKAQEQMLVSMYTGKNAFGDSFEKTEEIRRYFNILIETRECRQKQGGNSIKIAKNSKLFDFPSNVLFIIYEYIEDSENHIIVIPVTHDDYYKISKDPFRQANHNRALRLDSGENTAEIISTIENYEYYVRYIKRPSPIILLDLPDNLTINNETQKTECELNPILHRVILQEAVKLALVSYYPQMAQQKQEDKENEN